MYETKLVWDDATGREVGDASQRVLDMVRRIGKSCPKLYHIHWDPMDDGEWTANRDMRTGAWSIAFEWTNWEWK